MVKPQVVFRPTSVPSKINPIRSARPLFCHYCILSFYQPAAKLAPSVANLTRAVAAAAANMCPSVQISLVRPMILDFGMKEKIYCEGTLLDAVQRANLFADCKHFVDMPLKNDAELTLTRWTDLISRGVVTREMLASFVEEHFEHPEGELEECLPTDWTPETNVFSGISDESYRMFAESLHFKWPQLYRKIADKVRKCPDRYSIIDVPNAFMVPGGRFREMYYWDSFFTIKGLLVSEMYETVRGMIENMQHLIDTYGFVPNGNRVYYLNRSQPPLLTWCVHAYYKKTKDVAFVEKVLPSLKKELAFFQANRSIMLDGWNGPLYRYQVNATQPRPESYREDIESAEQLHEFADKCRLWGDIAAAAESGRDFSCRWFDHQGDFAFQMASTRTSQLVPVDLNAIICGNLIMMADLFDAVGDLDTSKWCAVLADEMRITIQQVLWNEEAGCWFDYDLRSNTHMKLYFDTNFFPLVTGAYHEGFDSGRVVDYLLNTGVLGFPGGIPTSTITSGQQWDFPNAWAPTSWVLIEGLRLVGEEDVAFALSSKWIRKNYEMFRTYGGKMFEKYNVVSSCAKSAGGGGEYEMQEGFGWTNGVILDLVTRFAERLRYEPNVICPCCVVPAESIIEPIIAEVIAVAS